MPVVTEPEKLAQPAVTRRHLLLFAGVLSALGAAIIAGLYLSVPSGDEGSGPVDALVVLGTPANLHGQITDMQRWRAGEAVREFRAGKAPRIVFSGGPTANQYVEADVMAAYAQAQGVPMTAIYEERRSTTTLQNINNSAALLRAHGWHSVEVVSTAEHLPRAAVLLETTGLAWRVHPAPTPGRSLFQRAMAYAEEAFGTAVIRLFGTRAEPVLHVLASTQHRVAWGFRWVLYKVEGRLRR